MKDFNLKTFINLPNWIPDLQGAKYRVLSNIFDNRLVSPPDDAGVGNDGDQKNKSLVNLKRKIYFKYKINVINKCIINLL